MVLGLGTWEVTLVLLALLVFFGPEHGPQALRAIGRWRSRVQRTMARLERSLDEERPDFPSGFDPTARPPEAEAWVVEEAMQERHRVLEEAQDTEEEGDEDGSDEPG